MKKRIANSGIVLWVLLSASVVMAQETTETTTTTETTSSPKNLGFQVDSIKSVNVDVDFQDQFNTGVSNVEDEHRVNMEEC